MALTKGTLRSSFIKEIGYDPDTGELTVMLASGREYTHEGVPQEVVTAFLAAPSPGRFYNAQIKGIY